MTRPMEEREIHAIAKESCPIPATANPNGQMADLSNGLLVVKKILRNTMTAKKIIGV